MKFTPYPLEQLVRKLNNAEGTAYPADHSFGLHALEGDSLKHLAELCHAFDACALNTCGAMTSKKRGDVKKNIYADVRSDQFKATRDGLSKIAQDDRKLRAHNWYESNQRKLCGETLWTEFELGSQGTDAHRLVLNLKNWWRRQQDFAHYTSHGVWYVASTILKMLDEYEHYAAIDLMKKKKKIPSFVFDDYAKYLTEMRKKIDKTKEVLCWSMIARLQVADKMGDLSFDDVMMSLVWKLESLNLLKSKNGYLKEQRRGLSMNLFEAFHSYVLDNGNEAHEKALFQLSWFKELDRCGIFKTDKHVLVMPRELIQEGLVPKRVWLRFLFRHRYFRYKFFKNKLSLIASLEVMLRKEIDLTQMSIDGLKSLMNNLESSENELKMMDHQCSLWQPRWIFKYIFSSTNRFIEIWREYSSEKYKQLEEYRVNSIIIFCDQLLKQYTRRQSLIDIIPEQEVFYLIDKLKQLCEQTIHERLQKRLKNMLSKMSTLKDCAVNESYGLSAHPSITMKHRKIQISKSEGVLETANNIDLFNLEEQQFAKIVDSVGSAAKDIEARGMTKYSDVLADCLTNIFMQYLQYVILLVEKKSIMHDKRSDYVEQMLLRVGQEHISARLEELKEIRKTKTALFSFQIKCESILFSYTEDGISDAIEGDMSSETETESESDFDTEFDSQHQGIPLMIKAN